MRSRREATRGLAGGSLFKASELHNPRVSYRRKKAGCVGAPHGIERGRGGGEEDLGLEILETWRETNLQVHIHIRGVDCPRYAGSRSSVARERPPLVRRLAVFSWLQRRTVEESRCRCAHFSPSSCRPRRSLGRIISPCHGGVAPAP